MITVKSIIFIGKNIHRPIEGTRWPVDNASPTKMCGMKSRQTPMYIVPIKHINLEEAQTRLNYKTLKCVIRKRINTLITNQYRSSEFYFIYLLVV